MSDIDSVVVDSLKVLDPKPPIREADMEMTPRGGRWTHVQVRQILERAAG